MLKCKVCKKPIEQKRNTKQYCSSTCRAKASLERTRSGYLSPEEIKELLNYYWLNERPMLQNTAVSKQEFLNMILLRFDVSLEYDKPNDKFVLEPIEKEEK